MTSSQLLLRTQALLERFRLPDQLITDPLTLACEAAVYAVMAGGPNPRAIAFQAAEILPRSATILERGLAMGIALCLASEPEHRTECCGD